MKYKLFAILGVLLMFVASAVAQEPVFTFNVPFAFTVGHQVFPAGAYTVTQKNPDLLLLRGHSAAAYLQVVPDGRSYPSYTGKMEFWQHNGTYMLAQVSGNLERWDLLMSRSEKAAFANVATPVEIGASYGK